jgi:site-specific DNA recombinase
MNCVTYARVSTERQAERELSLPAQRKAMLEYAERHGWTITAEFVEAGASGRSAERPELKALLARCRRSPTIDVVLVHKVDRLARNLLDHATIRALLKQRSIKLASVVENVDDTISGRLVENIMASLAEFYSANLGEETRKGMRMMVERGGWPHRPPRGYRISRGTDNRPTVEVDEPTARHVRRMFELYTTGLYSLNEVSRNLAAQGFLTARGNRIPIENIRSMLQNPFYIGHIRWKGDVHQGQHVPLVDPAIFHRASEVLATRARDSGQKGKHQFWLRGTVICGTCGHRMTAERHGAFAYYRCVLNTKGRNVCAGPYSNVRVSHGAAEELYRRLHIPEELGQALLEAARTQLEQKVKAAKRRLRSVNAQLLKLEEREVTVASAYAAGDFSPEAYRALKKRIDGERRGISAALQEARQDPEVLIARVKALVRRAQSLWQLHAAIPFAMQQHLVRIVFAEIVLDRGAIVGYALREPFDKVLRDTGNDGGGSGPNTACEFDNTYLTAAINVIIEHDIDELFGGTLTDEASA